jgi:DNA-binding MarR family transcriptional regulator
MSTKWSREAWWKVDTMDETLIARNVAQDEKLTRAADALTRLTALAVRRTTRKISLTAASTLATLERSGPRRITDLAVIEGITQPSMTALISTLERWGLVGRQADSADQRVVLASLTEEGQRYLHARRSETAQAFVRLIELLPLEEKALLLAAIPALELLHALDERQREGASPMAGD